MRWLGFQTLGAALSAWLLCGLPLSVPNGGVQAEMMSTAKKNELRFDNCNLLKTWLVH